MNATRRFEAYETDELDGDQIRVMYRCDDGAEYYFIDASFADLKRLLRDYRLDYVALSPGAFQKLEDLDVLDE